MKPKQFPGPLAREGKYPKTCMLNEEQKAWIREFFPKSCASDMAKMMGVSTSTFYRFIKGLGLKRTIAQQKRIWVTNLRKGTKKLEENGYYDSLRVKPLPEKVREGLDRYWQDVKEGKRLHPMKRLQKEHPRLYAKTTKRLSKGRKKLFRMERFRLISGEKQKTKIHLVVTPFSRSQVNYRHSAISRGYWFYDDCSERGGERFNIYWDSDTKRSARFEIGLKNAGFQVKDGTNL